MRRFIVPVLLGEVILAAGAWASPPPDLDARVERAMKAHPQFQPPGLALAIVEDGKVTWAKGYGVRRAGDKTPVDEHTIFPMGSCGKAFTAATLALLVDDGKLGWDDKVVDKLPGFRLYDPYASAELTVRDLLVHRSGLGEGAGDLMWLNDAKLTRKELVHQLRYIKPAYGFRDRFAYDNVLYGVAGQLVEEVSGMSWEQFVEKRIFGTLGMKDSVVSPVAAMKARNHATLHARLDGPMRGLGNLSALSSDPKKQEGSATAPAGSIWSSASDIALWLEAQLGHGALPGGKRLFTEAQGAEMWTPVVLEDPDPYPSTLDLRKANLSAYALGWTVQDYRGHKVIQHAGFVWGGKAVVMLVPEKNLGIAAMVNSEDGAPRWALVYALLDYYLGLPPVDWDAKYRETIDTMVSKGLEAYKKLPTEPESGPGPSLPIAKYAGVYNDPWYGTITITGNKGGKALHVQFDRTPSMHGALEHVRYDTFRTRFDDKSLEDAYVTFALTPDGGIDTVKMKTISPLADFSFDYQDLLFTPVKKEGAKEE